MKQRVMNMLIITIISLDPIIQLFNHGTGH